MKGNLLVLTIRMIVGMFFFRMVFAYESLFILAVGGTSSQIGIINSLRPMAGLVMFPISGYLTDRTGRVKIIVLAGFLSALIMLFYVFAPSWEWIALGSLLWGFTVFKFPPTSAILADSLDPKNRGIGIATMTTIPSAVAIFSPYIGAIILERYGDNMGMRILYGFLLLVLIFNAFFLLRFLKETTMEGALKPIPKITTILKESYSDIPVLLTTLPRSIKALGVVVLMGFIANGVAAPFWVVYVTEVIQLSKIEWGLILLLESILRVVITIPFGMIADKFGRFKTLLAAVVIAFISLPSLIFTNNFTSVLIIRLGAAIATSLFIPASIALMADYVPTEQRGRVMAAIGRGSVLIGATGGGTAGPGMGYLFTIPVMAASILGGVLYSLNPIYPWLVIAITSFIQILFVILFIRDHLKFDRTM
jgi:MFS family permease